MQGRQEVSLATRHLTAFIEGNPVGTLLQDEKGLVYFHYNPGYDGPPLSLSLPVSARAYRQTEVVPYLMGLLPDSAEVRRDAGATPRRPHVRRGQRPCLRGHAQEGQACRGDSRPPGVGV